MYTTQEFWLQASDGLRKNPSTSLVAPGRVSGMSHDRWEQVRLTLSPEVPIGRAYNTASKHVMRENVLLKSDENETLAPHVPTLLNLCTRIKAINKVY